MDILFDPMTLLRQSLPSAEGQSSTKSNSAALHKACQQFEAILLGSMFKEMRAAVPTDGLLGDDNAQKTYQSLMDQEIASELAKNQSVGIAENIYRQLAPQIEKQDPQDASSK